MNEGEVYFGLFGNDFDPDQVTESLGITPSRTKLAGTPVPRFSSWMLSSGKIRHEVLNVYDLSSELIGRLSPKREQIRIVIEEHGLSAVLQVVLRIGIDENSPMPEIGFPPDVIDFLAKVGASIDVDTYLLES